MQKGPQTESQSSDDTPIEEQITVTLDTLLPELQTHIVGFLPAYSKIGSHCVANISRKFNAILNPPGKRKAISIEAVLASCHNENDAKSILKDESLRKQLTFDQLLTVISYYPACANYLLDEKHEQLTGYQIGILGQQHLSIAQKILSNALLSRKCSKLYLCEKQLDIARIIVGLPEFNTMSDIELAFIGKWHPEIATNILTNPTLYEKLNGKQIASLSHTSLSNAQLILQTPVLINKLSTQDWGVFAGSHFEIAQVVFNGESKDKIKKSYLKGDATPSLDIAKMFLASPDFLEGQKYDHFVKFLCRAHPSLVMELLNSPRRDKTLSAIRSSSVFYLYAPTILRQVFQNADDLKSLEEPQLFSLGICDPKFGSLILNTPSLRNKIDRPSRADLIGHPSVATEVLNNAELLEFIGDDIGVLTHCHREIALHIFKTPKLSQRMKQKHIDELVDNHPKIALYLLKTLEQPDARILIALANKRFLEHPALVKALKTSTFTSIMNDHFKNLAENMIAVYDSVKAFVDPVKQDSTRSSQSPCIVQ